MDALGLIRRASAGKRLPQAASDSSTTVTGLLVQMLPSGTSCWVSIFDSVPICLPCPPSSWTGITTVSVLMRGGRPVKVLGPAGAPTIGDEVLAAKVAEITTPPSESRTVVGYSVRPQWSGTFRSTLAGWDQWNVGVFGGRSDLYQGVKGASCELRGAAFYGSQVIDLGADEITRGTVTLIPNGVVTTFQPVRLQAIVEGERGTSFPALVGESVMSWILTPGQLSEFELPGEVMELLRTGGARGLALVGDQYQGVSGTSHPAGMALTLDYVATR